MRQKSGILFGKNIANLIHHFFFSLLILLCFASVADAAGYNCPTYRKYTSCNSGYYISNCPTSSSSWTGQTISSSALTTGNSCKSCPSGYTCSGGLACPKKTQAATYQIQFNLNGGSGDTSPLTCTVGQTCDLYFHSYNYLWINRAGYVLIGWSTTPSNPETATWTVSYSSPGSYTYYAVWEECPAGTYKDSSWHAIDACQSCPTPSEGFEYYSESSGATTATACIQTNSITNFDADCSTGVILVHADDNTRWEENGEILFFSANAGRYINVGNNLTQINPLQFEFDGGFDFSKACEPCSGATYSAGGVVTSCTACPTATIGWTRGTGTGWSGYGQCFEYRNATSISRYCSSGQLRRYASSASEWSSTATEYTTFRADPGAYVSGRGINMTCTRCSGAVYSAGGDVTSCTACPTTTVSGWNQGTGTGWESENDCYFYRRATDISSYCAAGELRVTHGQPPDGQTPTAAIVDEYEAFQADPGAIVTGSGINTTCTQCGVGEYSAGGDVHACTSCPELTRGFEYDTRTGMSSYTQCVQGTTDPSAANANCMADPDASQVAVIQTAGSATSWGGSVLAVGVAAKPGAILDSQFQDGVLHVEGRYPLRALCRQCDVGSYSAGGTATSCTACLDNYTTTGDALTDHDSASDCKIYCDGGSYISVANATQCSNVGAGYWAPSSTIPQGSVGSRNACASGLTTIGSGLGADEAGDCGRVLNVGDEKIYLRSTKKTTPSLNISINGDVFYGNMSTATKGSLRINSGGTTYSVYDDSM